MKLIKRKNGILSGNSNLEKLHVIKNVPIFIGCVTEDKENDIFEDMHWYIDPFTGIIQLTKLIPLEILYQRDHFDSPGDVWKKYYDVFSDYIIKRQPKKVLEVGGGNGKLANLVCSASKNTILPLPLRCSG